jgi:hypothetical protein
MSIQRNVEPLEGRNLLSTVGTGSPAQPPVLASFSTQFVEEGNALAVQARATDSNPGSTVNYSLDPGAPAGAAIDPASGLLVWTPPNVQQDYAITVRATDSADPSLSDAKVLTVMVFDVPPGVQAGINATINPGTEFVRTGSFTDPNPDTWTALVDYGDGSGTQPLALNTDHSFRLDHVYTTPGSYIVSVTINDSQGGQGRGFFSVQVGQPSTSSSSPTPTPGGTAQGQGQPSGPSATGTNNNSSSNQGSTSTLNPLVSTRNKPAAHAKLHLPVHGVSHHKHK